MNYLILKDLKTGHDSLIGSMLACRILYKRDISSILMFAHFFHDDFVKKMILQPLSSSSFVSKRAFGGEKNMHLVLIICLW